MTKPLQTDLLSGRDWDRFWSKVERHEEGCWLWVAYRNRHGYGDFRLNGRIQGAHRVAYRALTGPIPDGLVLDHLCRTPACVRPDHLEPVPQAVNILRGQSPMARQARMTHCSKGHEFTTENTIVDTKGKRRCRTCLNAWARARNARRAAEAAA